MSNIYLNISSLPRVFSIAPKVRSIANIVDHPLMKRQIIAGLQICIRFHGTSDCACVNIDGRDYQAKYPHLFIKREGEIHQIVENGASDSFYFTYDNEDAPGVPADLVISEIDLTSEIQADIHHITELLPHSCESGVTDRIDGLCMQLLINLLLQCGHHEPRSNDEMKIQKISSYLQMHFTEDLNFNDIARHFGYSPRSFYRHWQNYYKNTPASYVSSLKLAESRRLLIESDSSVEEISERLRYSSSAYFVYYFRQQTGMTPLQYRKAAFS